MNRRLSVWLCMFLSEGPVCMFNIHRETTLHKPGFHQAVQLSTFPLSETERGCYIIFQLLSYIKTSDNQGNKTQMQYNVYNLPWQWPSLTLPLQWKRFSWQCTKLYHLVELLTGPFFTTLHLDLTCPSVSLSVAQCRSCPVHAWLTACVYILTYFIKQNVYHMAVWIAFSPHVITLPWKMKEYTTIE